MAAYLLADHGKVADGATRLDDGAAELDAGAATLADGTTEAQAGAQRLADGAGDLEAGAGDLSAGARKASAGGPRLAAAGAGARAALGPAVLAGSGIGESVHGLTTVVETTGATYWVVIGLASLVLLAAMLTRRLRGPVPAAGAAGGTAVVATAFVLAYRALGTIG